jgi:hypothetical protein
MKETTKLILSEYQMAGVTYVSVYIAGLLFSGGLGERWPFMLSLFTNALLFIPWMRLINYTEKEVREYRQYCRDRGLDPK